MGIIRLSIVTSRKWGKKAVVFQRSRNLIMDIDNYTQPTIKVRETITAPQANANLQPPPLNGMLLPNSNG